MIGGSSCEWCRTHYSDWLERRGDPLHYQSMRLRLQGRSMLILAYRATNRTERQRTTMAVVSSVIALCPKMKIFHDLGETHFGRIATSYLSQYVRGNPSIDRGYGIRRETNGTFMIGDSPLSVDEKGEVSVLDVTYEGWYGLWQLLTKMKVDRSLVIPYDMRS